MPEGVSLNVTGMTTRAFWKGEFGITGFVEDQGQSYKVKMDIKGSNVNSCSCSCAQGNSYKGMCSHAKAVLAHYREKEKEGAGVSVTTSVQVRTMIREYTNREVAGIIIEGEGKQVDFLPELVLGREHVKVRFKLGRGRYYVVKDLLSFVQAVEHGFLVEYGKNLAFHHSISIFTERSRPLVELVMELVGTYREHCEQFQKSSYNTVPLLRELVLGKASRDRVLELLMGLKMEVENICGVRQMVEITQEIPECLVKVRKHGKDGLSVSVDRGVFSFQGEKYLYLMAGNRLYRAETGSTQALSVFFEQMTQGSGAPYEVSVGGMDVPLFFERVLKKLEPYGILDMQGVDLESLHPVELKAEFSFDSPRPGTIVMSPVLRYGEYSFHPMNDQYLPRTVCRDVPGEFRISQVITRYFQYREPERSDFVIQNDDDALYQLLESGIEELRALGEIYFSDAASHLRILPPPEVSVGVSTLGSWLEITVDSEQLSGVDLQKVLNEYRQKKPYYRLKSGEFLRIDGEGLMTIAKMMDGLAIPGQELKNKKIRIPRYRTLYLDSLYKEYGGIHFYRDHLFKAIVRGMKSVEDSDLEIPDSLKQVLRGYQKEGFRWLRTLDAYGFGGILADDMGLGKTIQVIALLIDEKQRQETVVKSHAVSLIVCPASLVYNWECELHRFAQGLRVLAVTGSSGEREDMLKRYGEYDLLVTSYDLLKRDAQIYEAMEFRFQIIDEAQYIKNPSTQTSKAVKMIRAKSRYALTGTPVENRLSELWSIFDYLMPGFLFSYQRFKKTCEVPIVKEGNKEALKNLQRMTGPFILRRLKEDVLKELPKKLETVVYSRPEREQKELYMANAYLLRQELEGQIDRAYDSGKIQILAQLTKLRQICCDPKLHYENYGGGSAKLETCVELLAGAVEAGHKILLFSQFTSMLDIIGGRLDREKIAYHKLTGSTSKEQRLKMVNQFHKDQVPVFLISLKAGGTGLNLTAADVVIHYDPWWNMAAQNQATDRTHRIGQEKQVSVFKLIMKGTIEENILKLQESKKNLAEQIITEGTVSFGSLTKEELLDILL